MNFIFCFILISKIIAHFVTSYYFQWVVKELNVDTIRYNIHKNYNFTLVRKLSGIIDKLRNFTIVCVNCYNFLSFSYNILDFKNNCLVRLETLINQHESKGFIIRANC